MDVAVDRARAVLEQEGKRIEHESRCAALAHEKATASWRLIYLALGGPATGLAAAAGASALAHEPVVAAVLALSAAVASALMTFLNPSGQVADHRRAAGLYRAIENRARLWRVTSTSDSAAESARQELTELVDEWNKAIEGSPPLFERFRSYGRRAAVREG
jgi:hypothetical protein